MNTTLSTWPARRLRLKHHVFFRATPEGLQFDGGTRTLLLPAAGLQPLVERVIGLMDAGLALPALQARLPERLQPAVWRIVQALDAQGLLLDETDEAPWFDEATAPDALAEFARYVQDRADPATRRARWQAWREGTVLVAGHGHALAAAAQALADSGAGTVRVRDQAAAAEDFATVQVAVWASDEAEGAAAAAAFEQQARRHGVPAVAALRHRGQALVAPPVQPGLPGVHELLQWHAGGDAEPHSPASLALLGAVAAQAAMDLHFGIEPAQWQRQVRRVSPYLEVSRHPLVGAGERPAVLGPLVPLAAGAFADVVGQPADRTLSGYEQQRIALAPWFDALLGPFAWRSAAGDGSLLSQLPLYHDAVAVRAPGCAVAPVSVAGWGLNAEQAGTRALLLAVGRLAAVLGEGREPVASFDAAHWQALAAAHAVAAHPAFATQRHVAWLDLAATGDPTVHLLRQLLRHFAPGDARVLLHWHPRHAACVAQVWLGATLAGSACEAAPLAAVQEALGQACSRLQVADDTLWRGRVWTWPEPAPAQWQPPPADLARPVGSAPATTTWHRAAAANLPATVHCGHAVVQLAEVTA